jgi:hypothetical protein
MKKVIITRNKESLTTKLTLLVIGLTAASGLLVPATYASFHPVTTGEIADDTIRSADISNTAGVQSVDIVNGQVGSVDIGNSQVASVDIGDGQVTAADIANNGIQPNIQIGFKQIQIPAGDGFFNHIADCPAGTILSGGGFWAEPLLEVTASYPWDENTWGVAASNPSTSEASLHIFPICIGPMG